MCGTLIVEPLLAFGELIGVGLERFSRKIRRVALAQTGATAVESCKVFQPTVIVMELNLPDVGCAELVETLRVCSPKSKLVIFTDSRDVSLMATVKKASPDGFVHTSEPFSLLVEAVLQVAKVFQPGDDVNSGEDWLVGRCNHGFVTPGERSHRPCCLEQE